MRGGRNSEGIFIKSALLFLRQIPFSLLGSNYTYQLNQLLLTTYCLPIINDIAKKRKVNVIYFKTVNQSPVSFLDCTICRMRKTLLLVSLIPDRLLSALIKAHTKCHGTLGRKRWIVTIYHIFKINLSGSLLCNQRKFAKALRTKESVYSFLSLTLSSRLFHPVGYTVSMMFFSFLFSYLLIKVWLRIGDQLWLLYWCFIWLYSCHL